MIVGTHARSLLKFAIAAAFILQGILSFIQMRHLTNDFLRLRKKGKVPVPALTSKPRMRKASGALCDII